MSLATALQCVTLVGARENGMGREGESAGTKFAPRKSSCRASAVMYEVLSETCIGATCMDELIYRRRPFKIVFIYCILSADSVAHQSRKFVILLTVLSISPT
jgi:hypothetical protein